jgi:hypothetical protein
MLPDAVDVLAYRWQLTKSWRAFHATSPGASTATDWRQAGYFVDFAARGLLLPATQTLRDDERKARHLIYRASRQHGETEQLGLF